MVSNCYILMQLLILSLIISIHSFERFLVTYICLILLLMFYFYYTYVESFNVFSILFIYDPSTAIYDEKLYFNFFAVLYFIYVIKYHIEGLILK